MRRQRRKYRVDSDRTATVVTTVTRGASLKWRLHGSALVDRSHIALQQELPAVQSRLRFDISGLRERGGDLLATLLEAASRPFPEDEDDRRTAVDGERGEHGHLVRAARGDRLEEEVAQAYVHEDGQGQDVDHHAAHERVVGARRRREDAEQIPAVDVRRAEEHERRQ
eukprot:3109901-Prymnesium_polylepis.1